MKGIDRMNLTRTIAIPLALLLTLGVQAREHKDGRSEQAGNRASAQPKGAGCSPSTAIAELELNNVRTQIETGGNMWQRRSSPGGPAYEVPKTPDRSGAHSLFAGALWMGGFSPDNQLKLAAVRFRQVGNDYWPGPLTTTGDASVTSETCIAFDRTWKTRRQDAQLHDVYFTCLNDPDCEVNDIFEDGYTIPPVFFEWPAIGNVALGQSLYLAPFFDYNGDGDYQPTDGDYPGYDLDGVIDCKNKFREDPVPLFGDENIWWVFNDKGNAHTESGGLPIGMEIRAQAFAFSTNDEVNNMTFYNYVLINQGTQTLLNTYFGQWVDVDLGCSDDDFVGCDVQRGLGYGYNGDNNDEGCNGYPGYGLQPPAIGVDFFEGPFQDYDNIDIPLTTNIGDAVDSLGIPYKGIGIGYGDGVEDNERFGMRAFLYHNNNSGVTGDPSVAIQYYNYLRAIWKDNSPNLYGGTGHISDPDADPNTPAFYMFPGDSDPLGWGTGGAVQGDVWTEESEGNDPDDRRFIQSAGPFTLEPGAFNNVTVGVVWARAPGGGPFESVNEVRKADDKAQSLFDNCFQILDGPDAPDIAIQELDRELIVYIDNPQGNNINEEYEQVDPTIPESASDRTYNFQGYQLYQVANEDVSVADLGDVNQARLVFQCDVEDGIGQIVNYIQDPQINLPVPTEMVNGADEGIRHSVRISTDLFATGSDPRLVNFKSYYFICLAYAYNNYEDYNSSLLTGQPFPYLAGRKAASGSIRSYVGIPHKPAPENGGTYQTADYGDQFQITRLEGQGNGGQEVDLSEATVDLIMNGSPWRQDELKYRTDMGPVRIQVVDPLKVPAARFELWFQDSTATDDPDELLDTRWKLVNLDSAATGGPGTVYSDRTIEVRNEQLILDWGLSVTIEQRLYDGDFTAFLGAEVTFTGEPWLTGVPDGEDQSFFNWIRSGTSNEDGNSFNDYLGKDDDEVYENVLPTDLWTNVGAPAGGTWAPWPLCGDTAFQPGSPRVLSTINIAKINNISSTLVVLTPDKNKWTRAGVLENEENPVLAADGADKMDLRPFPSVDKNGIPSGQPGCNEAEATLNGEQPEGMGWFPGYAIDLESGERLNMAFSENSFWGGAIGRDMIFNPTDQLITDLGGAVFGGNHWIYVFRNDRREAANDTRMPQYDEGRFLYQELNTGSTTSYIRVFRACTWVSGAMCAPGYSMLSPQDGLVPSEVRIRLSVEKPYEEYVEPYPGYQPTIAPSRNGGLGLYAFNSGSLATQTMQVDVAESACDLIDVVPNPYYGYSGYETNRLDNRVKFINLPQRCTISIYNVSGTLVRRYRKDNDLTFLDWDLKNESNVPIAGGVYICHVDVPGVCERVVKWFGALRPVDLQNF